MASTNSREILPPDSLKDATSRLLEYCRDNSWAGYDPYDGLNSAVFAAIPWFNNRLPRLAFTQFMKRCPVNFRPLLFVPKEQNPKGLALFLSALIKLMHLGLAEPTEINSMVARLLELRSKGWSRHCWGYNFDWQTRTYLVPRETPNIICTTFAGNALIDAYQAMGDSAYLEAADSAGHFLLESLHRTKGPDGSCFSYTPLDRSQIHNANLLGAAFLARLHTHTDSAAFRKAAESATRFSTERMRPDGSWLYGEGPKQAWIDSFHTGYNLVALDRVRQYLNWQFLESVISKGYDYFLQHFFTSNHRVKYYHDRTFPIDSHAIAQAIITLIELAPYREGSLQGAQDVFEWALAHMRSDAGWFYYQKRRSLTVKIPYMRWSQAWMLLAMAYLTETLRKSITTDERITIRGNGPDVKSAGVARPLKK